MPVLTTQQQLESIQSAITKIEGGAQEYEIDTPLGRRRMISADIRWLYQERKRLTRVLARETRGGMRTRYGTAQ